MLAALLLSTAPLPEDPVAWHRYTVRVDAALTTLDVRACFADGLPPYLVIDHPLGAQATSEFQLVIGGEPVSKPVTGQVAHFPVPSDDGCIEWQSDLEMIADVHRMNVGYPAGDALVFTTATWFWRPQQLTRSRGIEFEFALPDGMNVSVPWHAVDDSGLRFRHNHAPISWPALMAIGELEQHAFASHGARFQLSITPGPATLESGVILRWLRAGIDAASTLWGTFPVDEVQLLAVPIRRGYDAAPWAEINRGGGAGAHFFVNAKASDEVFAGDWIATHEFVHLALPYVRRRDAWLPEGFASYYQAVLRARAGMISPAAAWQALYEGFLRGHHNTDYAPLRDDSRYMHARGKTMRVYWSGAAIAMLADVRLRVESKGAWSLDRVLREFNRCCRKPARTWSARELFERYDAIASTRLFTELYERHVYSRHFPRLEETWRALGIETDGERATLGEQGVAVPVREAIMSPPGTAANISASPDAY